MSTSSASAYRVAMPTTGSSLRLRPHRSALLAPAVAPLACVQRSSRSLAIRASASAGRKVIAAATPTKSQMLIIVPPHPLVKHWLTVARNEITPQPAFRAALAELGRILIYEAVRDWLPMVEGQVASPLGVTDAECVDPNTPVKVVPILRAGLVLLEQSFTVLPVTETYHLGMVRDEETLQPKTYLNKLPEKFSPDDKIIVSDPMLATGGTMMAAMDMIVSRGASPDNIRIISVAAAPPALKLLSEKYPGLRVYCAIIDPEVDERGFIVPGLGDAGDRAFGTGN